MSTASRRVIVIMAGGSGERFWPLSRHTRPKQLLKLTSPTRTLLQEAVDRLLPVVSSEDIYVVTGRHLRQAITEGDIGIPDENILAEPCKRNTAGCLAYAAACIRARTESDDQPITMGVVTADHHINNPEEFQGCLKSALQVAERGEMLVTMGIRPTRPDTGYGYIEMPAGAGPVAGSDQLRPAFPVMRFREKPDRESAARYLATGLFLWNSGMFFWRLSTFVEEFRKAAPEFAEAIDTMAKSMRNGDEEDVCSVFEGLRNTSIDYVLLEHAQNVATLPAGFGWDDVGTWDALERSYPVDEEGNVAVGGPVLIDAQGCIVYNEPGAEKTAVAAVGVNDLVLVVSDDAVLAVHKGRTQDVKAALAKLKERGAKQT